MSRPVMWLLSRLRRFGRGGEAVAAVEFALLLPVMLALYVGSVEVSTLITADRRVTTIANTMSDLVARRNSTISTADLDEYFAAAEAIIAPYSAATLTQVVTCVRVRADGSTEVVWSRGFNGGTARTAGTAYPLAATSEMNLLARNGYLIAAEVRYSYSPFLEYVLDGPFPLFSEQFYLPRFGGLISLT